MCGYVVRWFKVPSPDHIHTISQYTIYLVECLHDGLCDSLGTPEVQLYHLFLLLSVFSSVSSLLVLLLRLPHLRRFGWIIGHLYSAGDSVRQPMETVFSVLSSSILTVASWSMSTTYGPDGRRSIMLYRRFTISLAASEAALANWEQFTNR